MQRKRKRAQRQRFQWLGGAVLVLGISLLAPGCAMQKQDFEGTWVVTESLQPGISATSPQQAGKQLGLSMTYLDDQAQLGQRHCSSPRYATREMHADEFSADYQISSVSIFGNQDVVKEVRVTCDEPGQQLGQTLLLQKNGAAYTVKDGVYYKLEKAASQTEILTQSLAAA